VESLQVLPSTPLSEPIPESVSESQIPDQLLQVRKMAREGFLEYSMAVDPRYKSSWFHEVLTSKLQDAYERLMQGEKVRIILEVPPRHGKSECATIKFPSWVLGMSPNIPIIVCSYSADLAEDFGRKTRDIIADQNYKAIFDTRLRDDIAARGKWLTTKGGGYTATGVGGAITGRGFSLGIVDDPIKNRQDADSQVIRDMVWSWWKSTFYTRQEGGKAAIVVIMTRWHMDDLVGRLLKQEEESRASSLPEDEYDHWEVIKFPALAEEDEEFRKAGEALWPEKFSVTDLNNIRNNIDVLDWSALYQQNPILAENADFKQAWFRYFEEQDINGLSLVYTTTIDPAVSQKKSADNSSVITVGKDTTTGRIYVIEETTGRFDPLQLIDVIFYHQIKYRGEIWGEAVAYQAALKYFLEEEMRKRKIFFTFNEFTRKSTVAKEQRIRGLIPLYRTGMIYHRRSQTELERELLQFPKGRRDDCIDALSSHLEIVPATIRQGPKVKEESEIFDRFKAFG